VLDMWRTRIGVLTLLTRYGQAASRRATERSGGTGLTRNTTSGSCPATNKGSSHEDLIASRADAGGETGEAATA
jgi:hypothetical protein